MAAKRTAADIIAKRTVIAENNATGETHDLGPVGGQPSGEASEGAPTSTPTAQTPANPPTESGGAGGEGEPRIPKHRLDEVIAQRNEARDESTNQGEENAGLRKELDALKQKAKLAELKSGEGRPADFDDRSDVDKMIWLQEQVGSAAPVTETPKQDPDVLTMKAERQLMLKGYTMEEAVILNDIMQTNPNLDSGDIMTLAEKKAPDLFAGYEDEGESGSHPSHTTSRPRSTRTTQTPVEDPRVALRQQAKTAKGSRARRQARMELIKLARANPIKEYR